MIHLRLSKYFYCTGPWLGHFLTNENTGEPFHLFIWNKPKWTKHSSHKRDLRLHLHWPNVAAKMQHSIRILSIHVASPKKAGARSVAVSVVGIFAAFWGIFVAFCGKLGKRKRGLIQKKIIFIGIIWIYLDSDFLKIFLNLKKHFFLYFFLKWNEKKNHIEA